MSGFCGWIGYNDTEDSKRLILSRMTRQLDGQRTTPQSAEFIGPENALAEVVAAKGARISRAQGYLVAIEGRPEIRDPELARLARDRGCAEALVEGFHRHDTDFLNRIHGAFSLAIISERGSEALLAIDRIGGRHPLAYAIRDGSVVFGSHANVMQFHPASRSAVDPQAIYDYLYFHVVPTPRTARRDVQYLLPGTFLRIRDGGSRFGTYWKPSYREDRKTSIPELSEEFRELVRRCVRAEAEDASVGCFLSGGTDSSTIAGILTEVTGSPARTYSIGFDEQGFDEMEYARIAASRFRTEHHEYYVTGDDVLDAIPRVAASYAEPFGNASAVPAYYCARMAKADSVQRLLGGDGGDELFAGNERYATQHVFEFYQRIPSIVRNRLVEPLVFGIPVNDEFPVVSKVRSYIRQANIPMPMRLQRYNYFERMGVRSILEPGFLAEVDPDEPRHHLDRLYESATADTLLNRMLALDLRITLTDNDLPKVSRMCQSAGVQVVYPFLSDELVEFSFSIPSRLKLKGFKVRWFMKHALKDFLPREILRKKKHGFGLPFGVWLGAHEGLREFARQSLNDLKKRGVVRKDFVDELLQLHESEHASYYGVFVWVLLMLEQWYRAQEAP